MIDKFHITIIKECTPQNYITTLTIYAHYNKASKYTNQKIYRTASMNRYTHNIVKDFYTPFSISARTSYRKYVRL